MDIATNAVLAAVLLDVATAVNPLNLPLQTPLEVARVRQFHVGIECTGSDATLASVLSYEGGYTFWHSWGIIDSFCTSNAYLRLQDPREMDRLAGTVRYTEAECLAKFKSTLRALGHTNLGMLETAPTVSGPVKFEGKVLARYVFEWSDPKRRLPDWMKVVRGEVNAECLRVEYFTLIAPDFHRQAWPITLGQTNPPAPPKKPPAKPVQTDLEVQEVSREYALAFIRAVLPEVQKFGQAFGPPLASQTRETNLVMRESSVRRYRGGVWALLGFECGYQVDYCAGRVMTVRTPDIYSVPGAWRDERLRDTEEYRGPIRLTREQAAEKIRHLVIDKLGLPAKPLYLDAPPQFLYAPEEGATNGIRRYVFWWQRSETEEQRNERMSRQIIPDMSVLAEVDAVSGAIKLISLMHRSLDRSEPKIEIPLNPSATP